MNLVEVIHMILLSSKLVSIGKFIYNFINNNNFMLFNF